MPLKLLEFQEQFMIDAFFDKNNPIREKWINKFFKSAGKPD